MSVFASNKEAVEWSPKVIEDVPGGPKYGYEVVIVERQKPPRGLRERLGRLLLPPPEPIIISKTRLPKDFAIDAAKAFYDSPHGLGVNAGGYDIAVRAHDPLRLLVDVVRYL